LIAQPLNEQDCHAR